MSLQVWLPLNGNLNNQGLSEVTSTGGIVNDTGILGKCYACTSSNYITIHNPVTDKYNFSFSFWMKIPTTLSSAGAWSTMFLFRCLNINNNSTETSVGISWTDYNNIKIYDEANHQNIWMAPGNEFNYDKWCHYTIAHTGDDSQTTIKVYTDGVLRGTFTNSNRLVLRSGNIYLGSGINPSYGPLYFNDFRLYDHCLSSKEIKEISKGLVCHYKLNGKGFGNPNLIEDSSFLNNNNTTGSVYRDSSKLFNGKPTLKITRSGATDLTYTGWARTVTNVKAGDTIYASAWVYVEDISTLDYGCEWRVYQTHNDGSANNWSGWYSSSLFKEGSWVKVGRSYTLDSNLSSAVFNMNVVRNGTYWIAEPKVEFGSVPTPWCPHTSDTAYTSLGINSTTESDNSGYKYDGTLSESLPLASGSPRYGECYYFNSTSKRITLPTISMTGFANSFSISWWGKAPAYSSLMYWGFSNGNRLNYYDGKYCNTGDGGSNPYYKPNTTTTIDMPSVNVWHHFVMVGDGSTNKLYMDGALYGVAKTYRGITGSSIVINGWDSSTNYKTNGYISDFRIYATALSADDVRELYNTSASIDKSGNIYSYEFKEE